MDEEFTLGQEDDFTFADGNANVKPEQKKASGQRKKKQNAKVELSAACSVDEFYEIFVKPYDYLNDSDRDNFDSIAYKFFFSDGKISAEKFFTSFGLPLFVEPDESAWSDFQKSVENVFDFWQSENDKKYNRKDPEKSDSITKIIQILKPLVLTSSEFKEISKFMENRLWENIYSLMKEKCSDGILELEEKASIYNTAVESGLSKVNNFEKKFEERLNETYREIRNNKSGLPENLTILDVESSVKKYIEDKKIEVGTDKNWKKVLEKYKEYTKVDKGESFFADWDEAKWKSDFDSFCKEKNITLKDVIENFREKYFNDYKNNHDVSNLSSNDYTDLRVSANKYEISDSQWKDFEKQENIQKSENNIISVNSSLSVPQPVANNGSKKLFIPIAAAVVAIAVIGFAAFKILTPSAETEYEKVSEEVYVDNESVKKSIFEEFNGNELFVGSEEGQYTTIQDAINAASAGDVILVTPGVYKGALNISKKIMIRGFGEPMKTDYFTSETVATIVLGAEESVVMSGGAVMDNVLVTQDSGLEFNSYSDFISDDAPFVNAVLPLLNDDNAESFDINSYIPTNPLAENYSSAIRISDIAGLSNVAVVSNPLVGITVISGNAVLENCSVVNSKIGLFAFDRSNVLISGSKFYGNSTCAVVSNGSAHVDCSSDIITHNLFGIVLLDNSAFRLSSCKLDSSLSKGCLAKGSSSLEMIDCEISNFYMAEEDYYYTPIGCLCLEQSKTNIEKSYFHDLFTGILSESSANIKIDDVKMTDMETAGITVGNGSAEIKNCDLSILSSGVTIRGTCSATLDSVKSHHNNGTGFIFADSSRCDLTHCEAYSNGNGIAYLDDSSVSMTSCDVRDNKEQNILEIANKKISGVE
ncbi:MAG: right-handed parallel beta-helix repeat-containing protein [Treponema sp.]|nr:right-handed parallel beta-helix repeat-containing protein [Treponema sp.]